MAVTAAATENDNIRLGAINRRLAAQRERFDLICEFGLGPRTASEAQLKDALAVVLEILAQTNLSDENRRRLETILPADQAQTHWLTATGEAA